MTTAESTADDDSFINNMLSKRKVTMKKITLASVFLLKLFSSHNHSVQSALFVLPTFYQAPQKTCETFAGRTLFKNCNPSRAAQFLDVGRIWPAGRSLHTPGLRHQCLHPNTWVQFSGWSSLLLNQHYIESSILFFFRYDKIVIVIFFV